MLNTACIKTDKSVLAVQVAKMHIVDFTLCKWIYLELECVCFHEFKIECTTKRILLLK